MAMDPRNGQVKAYIGGINFRFFQYDMVNTGRRQIGSTVKPFLYSLAMEEGMTPCDPFTYQQVTLFTENGKPWSPRGARGGMMGQTVSIKWGLQNSDNMVTAHLMGLLSPYSFVRTLHTFGITGTIAPVVSMALGTPETSVGEMAGAYTAFTNKGIRTKPVYVTRIEDPYGNILAEFEPRIQEVFSEQTALKMLDMLRAVVDGGTGSRLRRIYNLKAPMGGKTGTTNSNSDGWFMGFTPKIVAATWVGGEEPTIHFDRMSEGQAASTALPIFGLFMQKLYADTRLGYSESDQFIKLQGDPCAGSIGAGLVDAASLDSIANGGIDEMFDLDNY
jgi:penicillin-binding protein 1A